MRVLLVSVLSVFALLAALAGVRFYGLNKQYKPFEHAFLKLETPILIVRAAHTAEVRSVLHAWPEAVFWLDVAKTLDGQILVLSEEHIQRRLVPESFPPEKWRGPVLERYTLEELRPRFPDTPLARDFIGQFPKQKFILNVFSNSRDVDINLVAALEKLPDADTRFLIQSPVDVVIKSIKKLKPLWVYGASQPELVRLLSLESVGVLPAISFDGDVYISPLRIHNRPAFNSEVLNEMRRRHKKIFLGPLGGASEYAAARGENPDGFIFATPELALKLFQR